VTISVQLDYANLLGLPDIQAFEQALSTTLVTNWTTLLTKLSVTMGVPTTPDSDQPTLTDVPLTSALPSQTQPEYVEYTRLDFSAYMACCQRYISVDNAATAATVATWLQSVHGLWFDPTTLTLGTVTPDPTRSDRSTMTVSVAATNYVWVGTVTLYVVADNHLALLAQPGTAKGLVQADLTAVNSN
jgi:hypothetical protein